MKRVPSHFYRLLRLGAAAGAALWLLGGCGWHHTARVKSYDREFTDEDRDPTYRDDPQRAGEEIRYVQ